jgi:DNA-binding transcriptional ArsR family regulator
MKPDPLSLVFAALADPTRREILEALSSGEKSTGDLAEPFAISPPAISRHLKVLETAGLIERKIDAQWRRCSLKPEGLKQANDWVSKYRKFWEDKLASLDTYLSQIDD